MARDGGDRGDGSPISVLDGVRIGVVVPPGSLLDHEYAALAGAGRRVFISRTDEVRGAMDRGRSAALASHDLLVPAIHRLRAVEPDVVAFACTAGSFVAGDAAERAICRAMEDAGSPRAVTTSGSLRDLLAARGMTRISVATPYGDELTESLAGFLGESGIAVTSTYSHGLRHPSDVTRIPPKTLANMIQAVDHTSAEGIFLSCTNLPTVGWLARLSGRVGKPVVSSNLTTMWGAISALGDEAGASELIDGLGWPAS